MSTLEKFYLRTDRSEYELPLSITRQTTPAELFFREALLRLRAEYYPPVSHDVMERKRIYADKEPEAYRGALSRTFFSGYYLLPTLHQGSDSRRGIAISLDTFLERTAMRGRDPDHNNVTFLIGEMGAGKTTLMNYIISERLHKYVNSNQLWFVRLDVEPLRTDISVESKVVNALSRKAHKVLEQLAKDSSEFASNPLIPELGKSLGDPHASLTLLRKLINNLQEHGRRLFLIVDNLDFLVHQHDRALFFDDPLHKSPYNESNFLTPEKSYESAVNDVQQFVDFWSRGQLFGDLSVNVLLVMRKDTFDFMKQMPPFQTLTEPESLVAFSIIPPDTATACKKRLDHVRYFSAAWKDSQNHVDLLGFVDSIDEHMETEGLDGLALVRQLEELTNGSLRDFMRFLPSFGAMPMDIRSLSSRLGSSDFPKCCSPGLLAFMLNSKRLYSQFGSGFPNIYLSRVLKQTENPRGYTHPVTYWLKVLLLKLVQHERIIDPDRLIEIMCLPSAAGLGYPQNLVRECLGSLADALQSNMLQVHRTVDPQTRRKISADRISLTRRASYCLANVFERFCYLQLVVNDYYIVLPTCLAPEFPDPEAGYSFDLRGTDEYIRATSALLTRRARQVLLFLGVLEAAMRNERKNFQGTFDKLQRRGIDIPTVEAIRTNVTADFRMVKEVFPQFDYESAIAASERQMDDVIACTIEAMQHAYEESRREQDGLDQQQ